MTNKIASTSNERIMLCERGAGFDDNMLVSDMRSRPIMAETGNPVVSNAIHLVQLPGDQDASSSGQRQYIEPLARAALAVSAVLIEIHEDPVIAPLDGPTWCRTRI